MAANICTLLKTTAFTELNRQGMNILVVKNTVHARMKEICAKVMMITLAGFDAGHFKVSHKEQEEERLKKLTF